MPTILTPSLIFILTTTIVAIFLSPAAAAGDIATTAAARDAVGTYLVVVCRANGPKENGENVSPSISGTEISDHSIVLPSTH